MATGLRCALLGATLLCVAAVATGCDRPADVGRALRVERFRQAGQSGVFLNEVLVVHLSAPLDPASVHRSSARVVDASGRPVEGRFEVDAERLRFHPRPPLRADLADGTFRPGARYRLELAGFPRPDGIRGRGGEPLAGSWAADFAIAAEVPGEPLFEDPTLWRAEPLTLVATEIDRTAPLELRCGEPLDPRSVRGEAFQLLRYGRGADGESRLEPIPMRAELVANDPVEGALVNLVPLGADGVRRALEPGEHHLGLAAGEDGLRDFGGNPVGALWGTLLGGLVPLTVVDRRVRATGRSVRFEFLSPGRRSPEAPAGVDGTAWWDDGGLITVRLPAAVGDGSDGATVLGAGDAPRAVEATSLTLPAGHTCQLPERGPVVLRAQGRVSIEGRLERRLAAPNPSWDGDAAHEDWIRSVAEQGGAAALPGIDFGAAESLSSWLAGVLASDEHWTVIVAGGDLAIDGELLVDGPVVLVAGGWVRVGGRVSASEVWKSDLGFGARLARRPRLVPLDLDAPTVNPLRVEQRWTVLSSPLRPDEEALRWTGARVEADPGGGRVAVRYLGERPRPGGGIERVGPVDDPVLLEDSPSVRILVELTLGPAAPGQPWLPPRLDSVELTWQPAADRP